VAQLLCKLYDFLFEKLKYIYFIDIASGSTVDWAYDVLKIRFSFTMELPPTQSKLFDFFSIKYFFLFLISN
jgi:hypothetical protein